jgi:hypothetical protein
LSSSKGYFSYVYGSYVSEPDDDMIADLFKDTQPLSSSILEEYQNVATLEPSELHSSKRKYSDLGDFHLKVKRQCFSTLEIVHYLLPSSSRGHALFFRSLISS